MFSVISKRGDVYIQRLEQIPPNLSEDVAVAAAMSPVLGQTEAGDLHWENRNLFVAHQVRHVYKPQKLSQPFGKFCSFCFSAVGEVNNYSLHLSLTR